MAGFLKIDGRITREESVLDLSETTAPADASGIGKFYASSVDNKPRFVASDGTDYDLTTSLTSPYWSRNGTTIYAKNAGDYLALGQGTITTANFALHIDGNSTEADSTIRLVRHYTTGTSAVISFMSSGGSQASPTAIGSTHRTGRIDFGGYDGDSYEVAGRIEGEVTPTLWSNSERGMELNFYTVAAGATTLAKRMTICDNGWVGIGTDSASNPLEVVSSTDPLAATKYHDSATACPLYLRRARGTATSPSDSQAGDVGGSLHSYMYRNGAFRDCGYIDFVAEGTVGTDYFSNYMVFANRNTSGTLTEHMRIRADGDVVLSNGSIQLSDAGNLTNGTVRYSGSDFEGRLGGAWVSLTGGNEFTQAQNTDVDSPSEVVDSFADTVCSAASWHYVVSKGSNYRSGLINACWNAASDEVKYRNISTADIGDTSDVVLSVSISSNTVQLIAAVASNDWSVKTKRLLIDD